MDSLSAWAWLIRKVRIISLAMYRVLVFSFSKYTPTPHFFSLRMYSSPSNVLRQNRETDLVMTRSILPFSASRIILLNWVRFLVEVPMMPSSAYSRTIVQPSVSAIRWV